MQFKILEKVFEGESPESVFEIGCGGGGLLKDVAECFGCKTGGIDISKVRMEATKGMKGEYIVHDLNDPWPVSDNSYDIAFSVGVLMYIFNPAPVIQEMLRVSKKGIILAEYNREDLDEYGGMMMYLSGGNVETALIRNYEKVFEKIGKKVTIEKYNNDKTIIKCLK